MVHSFHYLRDLHSYSKEFTLLNDLYIISEIQASVVTWPPTSRAIIRPTVITPKIFLKKKTSSNLN